MARYIDADELIRLIKIDAICNKPYSRRDALACVRAINTADVVPRAEVEALRATLEMLCEACKAWNKLYLTDTDALVKERKKTEIEVASEIFEEIDEERARWEAVYSRDYFGYGGDAYGYLESDVDHTIAELKKKYTEEK